MTAIPDPNYEVSPQEERRQPPSLRKKIVQIIFLTVAVVCTLLLGWWQWTRFQSGGGSFQNLGYALQWPFFGGFIIYAYRKYLRYEEEIAATGINPEERKRAETAQTTMVELPEDFIPQRQTMSVEEYNRRNAPRRRAQDF